MSKSFKNKRKESVQETGALSLHSVLRPCLSSSYELEIPDTKFVKSLKHARNDGNINIPNPVLIPLSLYEEVATSEEDIEDILSNSENQKTIAGKGNLPNISNKLSLKNNLRTLKSLENMHYSIVITVKPSLTDLTQPLNDGVNKETTTAETNSKNEDLNVLIDNKHLNANKSNVTLTEIEICNTSYDDNSSQGVRNTDLPNLDNMLIVEIKNKNSNKKEKYLLNEKGIDIHNCVSDEFEMVNTKYDVVDEEEEQELEVILYENIHPEQGTLVKIQEIENTECFVKSINYENADLITKTKSSKTAYKFETNCKKSYECQIERTSPYCIKDTCDNLNSRLKNNLLRIGSITIKNIGSFQKMLKTLHYFKKIDQIKN